MSDARDNAERRREILRNQLEEAVQTVERVKEQLARVDQFIQDYDAYSADHDPYEPQGYRGSWANTLVAHSGSFLWQGVMRRRNSKKEEVAAVTRDLLEHAEAPISRPTLLTMLLNRGLVIAGGAPETVLSTMLWRTRDVYGIVHLRNFGYWLRNMPFEPAGYDPDFDEVVGVAEGEPEVLTEEGDD